MSAHHPHSRPLPLQNNSQTSTSGLYRDKTIYESPGHSPVTEADRPAETLSGDHTNSAQLSVAGEPRSMIAADRVSSPSQAQAVTDDKQETSPPSSSRPSLAGPRSPIHSSSFSHYTSPGTKQQDTEASSSLAAMVMDVAVSPKQRVDGFEPSINSKSVDDDEEVREEAARNPVSSTKSPPRQEGHTQTSAAQSRSPRHVRINEERENNHRHPSQEPPQTNPPTGNSDSSYTPASSPPPKTPSSDDITLHGDHETSADGESRAKSAPTQASSPSSSTPDASGTPHMDLATFPTQDLLRLLASLLQQIASANDSLREEVLNNKSEASSLKPTSPSSRNRTRKPSSSEKTGKFCIPPFRPRPAHIEGERRHSHSHPKSPTEPVTGETTEQLSQEVSQTSTVTEPAQATSPASGDNYQEQPGVQSSQSTSAVPASEHKQSGESSHSIPDGVVEEVQGRNASESDRQSDDMHTVPDTVPRDKTPGLYKITTTAARQSLVHPSAILCFHARNVPSISIEAYLQRILKYCPITNEVFLSLLVYFDRMSKMQLGTSQSNGQAIANEVGHQTGIRGFAIDSYNVHRLVIAGITVASKFFSDVFYTNSRYAKVSLSLFRRSYRE
ncbi:hypothetical protein QFC19_001969 [Naganishia cerealis]|uniref:Uncharacterized protein n=1 Tax=Naganishia cerealis TaxID=610337 RepID=A0ACC2WEX5_9TREE|nr:hypothetical protein QFC19_001969 [Naganishia cerealis]